MIRLGIRLALAGGRGALAGVGLTATAVAVGTAILLFAISFAPAVADRDARTAWRDGQVHAPEGSGGTLLAVFEDHVAGRLLTRVQVAPAGGTPAPVPPAFAAMPRTGEAYVSPALGRLMADLPADALAERIGRVVGVIEEGSLASPDELVAVIGTDPALLRAYGAVTISGFGMDAPPLELPPIGALIVVLAGIGALAPVAVFVATATRMSAARRDLRLAALRLVGATPGQVTRLAVVEALVATSLGTIGGIVLFFILRPLIAHIPLDQTTWWPTSISPPPALALVLLVGVQVAGAAAALITMRRLTISPLGVQRRSVPGAPSGARIVPLVGSIIGLLAAVWLYRSGSAPQVLSLAAAGLAFGGVIASIALAGPWLTGRVGRLLHRSARGGASLLAARRLGDDPRGSFGAIAGVIMAIFVVSAFFTFASYARSQEGSSQGSYLPPAASVAWLGNGSGLSTSLATRVGRIDGVTGVLPIREVALVRDEGILATGWLVDCGQLVRTLGLAGAACGPTGVDRTVGWISGRFTVVPDVSDATGATPPQAPLTIRGAPSSPLFDVGALGAVERVPGVIISPTALGAAAVSARFPVTRMYVTTDGSAGVGQRVRTAILAAAPAAFVDGAGDPRTTDGPFAEIGRIVALGLLFTLGLAGCSLAVAVTTATLERRRQFVFLRSAGMPASTLRATILLQAGIPLAAVAAASALLGVIVGAAVILVARGPLTLPDGSIVLVLVASLAVAMGIVSLTLPPLERLTRPSAVRHE